MHSPSRPLICALRAGSIGVLSMLTANTAFGIEPPPDNAKPPAELEGRVEAPEAVAEKLPFIGVVTASVPEMVADHVNLEHGTGLIVRTVMPNSPAEQSGIKVNDIILSINEAPVNDPDNFSAKIRSFKIGDKLKLKTIQKGKPTNLEVTLAQRPVDEIAGIPNQAPLLFEGLPEDQAKRLRELMERNLGALGQEGFEELLVPNPQADERLRLLRERMNQALENAPEIQPEPGKNFQFQKQSTIRMMDQEGSVEIKSIGDATEVTVRDRANEVVWSGPWDTEQDKAAAPDDIRQRIEKLNIRNGGGLKLEFKR